MLEHLRIARAAAQALLLGLFAAVAPAGAATVPESPDPIVIGKLDWTGQEITAEIAGEILRRMGYKVQFVQTTQVPLFQAVADGQITAYLENWNQNSKKYYDEFTKDGRIEPLGATGLKGQEGWYYPDYVAEKCPGLPDWRALQKCADIFATPDTAPKGRLLDYPAEWTPDSSAWVKAWNLDLVTVPSGGEGSTAAEVKSAVARKEPILLQWWEPTWLASIYNLKRVTLDDAGEGCKLAGGAGITSKKAFDCKSKGIDIVKFGWPGLKDKWPAAHRFLKAYQITNEQQGPLAMAVETEGKKASEVAKKWVDENEAVWKPWVDQATQ
ncbi:MAG: ABC transporter substrate-binding protein [Aestuariivirgaceae bacterium]